MPAIYPPETYMVGNDIHNIPLRLKGDAQLLWHTNGI